MTPDSERELTYYHSGIRKLLREWVACAEVRRVAGDDDGIAPTALVRPTTELTKAVAGILMGAGAIMPHGDGVYRITWTDA
jgi:hypothetical protein